MRPGRHSQSHPQPPVVSAERAIDVGSRSWGQEPPVLQWFLEVAATIPEVAVAGIDMSGQVAVAIGWEALRDALHSRGIRSHEDLAEWTTPKGSRCVDGALISAPGPRRGFLTRRLRLMPESGSSLESLSVRLTLAECQRRQHPQIEQHTQRRPKSPRSIS